MCLQLSKPKNLYKVNKLFKMKVECKVLQNKTECHKQKTFFKSESRMKNHENPSF